MDGITKYCLLYKNKTYHTIGITTYCLLYNNRTELLQSSLNQQVTFDTKKNWPYKKGGHLKESNSYEIFYDKIGKGDFQIQVSA